MLIGLAALLTTGVAQAQTADLTVSNVATDITVGAGGDPIEVTYTRSNIGTGAAGPYRVSVRVSTDATIDLSDPEMCGANIASQDPGTDLNRLINCTIQAGLPSGSYRVGVIIDALDEVAELDEGNNIAGAPTALDVTTVPGTANLTVSAVSLDTYVAAPGAPLQIRYTRSNTGTGDAGPYRLSVRLSADAAITTSDLEVCGGYMPTGQLAMTDLARVLNCTVPAVAEGPWTIGVIMDVNHEVAETDELDNTDLDPLPLWVATLQLTQSPLVSGSPATLTATGAAPGETVHFVGGLSAGPGPCPPVIGGRCIDVGAPLQLLGNALADGTGTATFVATVPAVLPPSTAVYTQAVVVAGAGGVDSLLSNPVADFVN